MNGTQISLSTVIPGTNGLNVLDTIRVVADARCLALACITWLIYDFVANLREEVELIWEAGWSTTKVCYILNRFLAPIVSGTQCIVLFFNYDLDAVHCSALGRFISITHFVLSAVQGSTMALRVWYMWTHKRSVQWLVIVGFLAAMIGSMVLVVADGASGAVNATRAQLEILLKSLAPFPASPLNDPVHTIFCLQGAANTGTASRQAPLFLVLLAGQGFLFVLTLLRVRSLRKVNSAPLTSRLVRDGIIFFAIFFLGLGVDVINAAADKPMFELPFFYANFTGVVQSIIVSHLILSIRSLAARLSSDPGTFLFNDAEMRRLYHLHGVRPHSSMQGDIIVNLSFDVDAEASTNTDIKWVARDSLTSRDLQRVESHGSNGLPVLSRVGVFEPTFARSDTPASRYALRDSIAISDGDSFMHIDV